MPALDHSQLSPAEKRRALLLYRQKFRLRCEADYSFFFRAAWREAEPESPLVWNWHIKYLCDRLQAEVERIGRHEPKTKDLIINVPPRSSKTRITTEFLQPWAWTRWPWLKMVSSSYDGDLSRRKTANSRRMMQSRFYQSFWGDQWDFVGDQNAKTAFQNDKGGFRIPCSTGSRITGDGGDIILQDDPINPKMASSETSLIEAVDYFRHTLYGRLNDQKIGLRIIVMQRLHEDDICGWAEREMPGKFAIIRLPAEESDDISPPELRARYVDGLLDPERFPLSVLDDHKKALGQYGYAGQFLQRPSPDIGGMFKKINWGFWMRKGDNFDPVRFKDEAGNWRSCGLMVRPEQFDDAIQVWDCTFGDTENAAYVSGGHLGKSGPNIFVCDEYHQKADYPATVAAVRAFSKRHPRKSAVYVEGKANGVAIVADLKREIQGLQTIDKVDTDKVTRATPLSRGVEAHNIWLPHPSTGAAWVFDFIDEFAKFPRGKYNDRVDMLAHGFNRLSSAFKYQAVNVR